jgi:hypothetical protein
MTGKCQPGQHHPSQPVRLEAMPVDQALAAGGTEESIDAPQELYTISSLGIEVSDTDDLDHLDWVSF